MLLTVRIDALDITVLRGGANDVGQWATDHGFRLPPDAPEVLDFYASRSPIFLAAVFDGDAARERGQAIGDGTPVHITIPTDNPWVPLRILALGKTAAERVQADVYLLTDSAPLMLPAPEDAQNGLFLQHYAAASDLLLSDLRSDKGMEWVPQEAWLTKVGIDAAASDLRMDLAIDATGVGQPSVYASRSIWPSQAPSVAVETIVGWVFACRPRVHGCGVDRGARGRSSEACAGGRLMTRSRLADWLAVVAFIGTFVVGVGLLAAGPVAAAPDRVEIHIRYSHFNPSLVTVAHGRPVTVVLVNDDPIEHEWIVGNAEVHRVHRTGTEAHHASRPTEISIPPLSTVETTITFPEVSWQYICHLPGHEAYGMVGLVEAR